MSKTAAALLLSIISIITPRLVQNQRPTQKRIAALAGLATSTVCLALQDHPSIPPATRAKIRLIATQIGYSPDPMLSALAAYRTATRPPAFHGQLAWLTASSRDFKWSHVDVYVAYMKGAVEGARRHGYSLLEFDLSASGMTPRRLAEIMRARNVRGILVCPQPEAQSSIEFPWDQFSAVTLGHTMASSSLYMVATNHFQSTRLIFQKLTEQGYQRIGLALDRRLNDRVGQYFLAAYLIEQRKVSAHRQPSPYLGPDEPNKADFARWLKIARPDALITTNYRYPDLLQQLKWKVPDDLGVAVVFKKVAGDEFAGIDQKAFDTGMVAMNVLVSMIQRNERGIPALAQQILVEGKWIEGATVRRIAK